ncbi:hypothetical protein MHYP_G00119140 [Metynnis hypsauchen]
MAEYGKKDLEKELDNKFGVGNWQWKTLEEQIMILDKAVYDLETEPKKCKKLKQDTEEQLRKWMQVKGKSPQDQTSLGQALNDFTASAMKELGEAKAEHEKAGTFKKGKVRKRLSEAKQNIAKIRSKCTYNGNLDRMVQSGGQAPPPPYVNPTPGIYPVIDVQSGTIDIKPQQPALTTQCTERIREWMCQTQNQPRAAQSTPLEYNFNPNNPFGNRVAHEQPNAPPIDPQTGGGPTLLRRPTQDGSPFSPPVVSGAHGFGKGCTRYLGHDEKKWPVQASSTVPSYPWDGKTNPAEYMGLAAEDWINRTSTHPGHEGVQQMWFRTAVLKGIPEYVRSKMEEDPNMGPDATHDAWLKTILFHMNKHKEKVDTRTGEVDKLQFELVKAQLAEARKTLNEDKKKSKPGNMVVTTAEGNSVNYVGQQHPQPQPPIPQPPPPQTQPLPYQPQPIVVQYQPTPYGGPYRGRGRGRGRGNRGGGRGPQQYDSGCFLCGAMDHWARHCTQPPWQWAGAPHPPQPQHQATYYPAPHPGAAPGGQYQMSPWGKEH